MKNFLGFILTLVASCLWFSLLMARPPLAQSAALAEEQDAVLLAMPTGIVALTGYTVTVPIAFASGGNQVGSTTFSIDYDESCLAFDAEDKNNDGRPDAVKSHVPPAFRLAVSYNISDTDGELDFVIADYSFPIASLPDKDELLSVRFMAICTPEANTVITAPVVFSQAPVASFGDPNGQDVAGTTQDGAVEIQAEPVSTATPTPSATPTLEPNTPTPTATPTHTPTATPLPRYYFPLIMQDGS